MRKRGTSWKTKLIASSLVAVFLFAGAAAAEMKLFPMWERMSCGPDPVLQFACYDFAKAQTILKLDLDLQLQLTEFETLKTKYGELDAAYGKLGQANTLLQESISRLDQRNKEKQVVLEKTTFELKKAESRSIWNYLPWFIVGTVLLTGAGFGIGFYLGTR